MKNVCKVCSFLIIYLYISDNAVTYTIIPKISMHHYNSKDFNGKVLVCGLPSSSVIYSCILSSAKDLGGGGGSGKDFIPPQE